MSPDRRVTTLLAHLATDRPHAAAIDRCHWCALEPRGREANARHLVARTGLVVELVDKGVNA
jgi:hypothetical protein